MAWKWTKELEEAVRALWGEGASAREIAEAVGAPSRNVILGRLTVLGLFRRPGRPRNKRLAQSKNGGGLGVRLKVETP